jgi:galactokinase
MQIADFFKQRFVNAPVVCVEAPGRVNLIGEHIDYSGGHVLPMAIGCSVRLVASLRNDGRFRLVSRQFDTLYDGVKRTAKAEEDFWTNYLFGVIAEFEKIGHEVNGLDAVVDGDIPRGSGLSSSAALEVATAWALQSLLGSAMSRMEIALLAQRAENQFVGVNCGIMDQAISAGGREGHAMLLDCDHLEAEHVPLELSGRAAILVAHSGVHRGLTTSAYNDRRGKCDAALEVIRQETGKDLSCLCEAMVEDLEAARGAMDDEMARRARHAVTEEARVKKAVSLLKTGDLEQFGALLNASHASLRDDYEVSSEELDTLTDMIRRHEGVYGSRLTGAGFGGCTVSLVAADVVDGLTAYLKQDYYRPGNLKPVVFATTAYDGVHLL